MTDGYLADDLREAAEEPVPCPADPRAKKNQIRYRPALLGLTGTQKKRGPKSTRSSMARKTFAKDHKNRTSYNPSFSGRALLSQINLGRLESSSSPDKHSRGGRSGSPVRSIRSMRRYQS